MSSLLTHGVLVKRVEFAGVPCLRVLPAGAGGPLRTVVFYHGWHSSKEQERFRASILACGGVQVIVPDALHHGERHPADHDAPGYSTSCSGSLL